MNESGRQRAAKNVAYFEKWIAERELRGDWSDYDQQGRLNRSEIAAECGFGRSAFRQNPALKERLESIESDLTTRGVLKPRESIPFPDKRDKEEGPDSRDRRIQTLEQTVAAQRAEIIELRAQLRAATAVLDDLAPTGKRLHPGFLGEDD